MLLENIIIFNSQEFGNIRTIVIGEKPYFMASDVAKALGYKKPNNAVSMHCRSTLKRGIPISGKIQDINFIPEGDVYRLIIKSKLPSAEKFESWVMDDVLPTLRKTGTYSLDTKPDSYTIENPAARARRWAEEYEEKQLIMQENAELMERNDELKNENDEMRPKAKFHDDIAAAKNCIFLGEFAAIIQNNHNIKIGEKRLFEWCRNNDILCSSPNFWNKPKQKMLASGYMQVSVHTHKENGKKYVSYTPLLTGKGQIWLTDKIVKSYED